MSLWGILEIILKNSNLKIEISYLILISLSLIFIKIQFSENLMIQTNLLKYPKKYNWTAFNRGISNESVESLPLKADFKFMSMFIGLIDGDGYLEIGPQKQYNKLTKLEMRSTIRSRLVLRLEERDLNLLKYLQSVLNTGSLDYLKDKNQYRLIFSKSDLKNVIIPLISKYELYFLVSNRRSQFKLLNYILDNNIKHWDQLELDKERSQFKIGGYAESDENGYLKISNLVQFPDWLIGFTIAEGSFGIKSNGSAFYSIRQTGILNMPLIQAIQLRLLGSLKTDIKPDNQDSYKITMSSREDIQKIVNFFSYSNHHPLLGYKSFQYKEFIIKLKNSKRYSNLNLPLMDSTSLK